MTRTESHGELERKALELLPWYVNGTLAGEERELVNRQVSSNITCRKELDRLRRLQELMRRDDAEAVATGRAFERLMERINSSDATRRSQARTAGQKRAWAPLALAASMAMSVAVLLWWWAAPPAAPGIYKTLTSPQPTDPGSTVLRIVFAPGVGETERIALLADHRLRIIGQPADDGVVTLAFAEGADQAAIVAALKQDPRILLVTSPPGASSP